MLRFILIACCGCAIISFIIYLIRKYNEQDKLKTQYTEYLGSHYRYTTRGKEVLNKWGKELPRVTFDRFLTLYSVSPEKWVISTKHQHNGLMSIPIYINNGITAIALFWETPEDLEKYLQWVDNDHANGNSQLYAEKREADMKKLINFIQEDMAEDRRKFQEEMDALEAQTRQLLEDNKAKEKPISLKL